MKNFAILLTILFASACGKDNSPTPTAAATLAPKNITLNQARTLRTYTSTPANFTGKYEGKISLTNGTSLISCNASIEINQDQNQIKSIVVRFENQGFSETYHFPDHLIKGNDLNDSSNNFTRTGKIDQRGLYIDRRSEGKITLEMKDSKKMHVKFYFNSGTIKYRNGTGYVSRVNS